jgi:anti-anti-sigma regulatory factor
MNISVSRAQGRVPVTILCPQGELDASNYQELIWAAQEVVRGGGQDILLDLSQTTYMSSSGLVALQSTAALLRGEEPPDPDAGWGAFRAIDRDREAGFQEHFKLLNPQPRVDHVLDMVGFKLFLEVYDDLEAAIASF